MIKHTYFVEVLDFSFILACVAASLEVKASSAFSFQIGRTSNGVGGLRSLRPLWKTNTSCLITLPSWEGGGEEEEEEEGTRAVIGTLSSEKWRRLQERILKIYIFKKNIARFGIEFYYLTRNFGPEVLFFFLVPAVFSSQYRQNLSTPRVFLDRPKKGELPQPPSFILTNLTLR